MAHHYSMGSNAIEVALIALQTFIVVFLLLHDWIPLGSLNNVSAKQGKDTLLHQVFVTLLGVVPTGVGLFFTAKYFGEPYPHWLEMWLWITYGLFLLGMLRAWWIPYLVLPDPERAARYQAIFAGTHSFLPRRNGIVPDTLHVSLHLATVATMLALLLRDHIITRAS